MSRILGLDITGDALRGAVVRLAFRRVEVERYAEVPLRQDGDPDANATALAEAMQKLVADLDRTADGAVVALSGEEASLRRIELPAAAAKRLKQVLPFELEALLPFDLEESIVDYQPIARTETSLSLLATAVPKARVGLRLAELAAAGIDSLEMAVGAASLDGLVHVVPILATGGPHVLVHIDANTTELLVLDAGHAVLARTLSGGVEDVEAGRTEEIESGLRRTLATFRAQGGAEPVTAHLSGIGAESAACASLVERVLEKPIPVLPLPTPPIVPPEWAPRFARALSLASRMVGREKRLNLRQGEFAATRSIGGIRKHAPLLAICGAFVAVCFLFSVIARRHVLTEEHEVLVAQLATTTEQLFGEEAHTAAEARALLRRPASEGDPMPAFDAFDALDALSRNIPSTIRHTTRRLLIEIDDETRDGRFEIEGEVQSIADRDTIATALEGHGCFPNLERGPTRPGRNNEGTVYRIESSIRCPDGPGGGGAAGGDDDAEASR